MNLDAERVLVTGAAGSIGDALMSALAGFETWGTDRDSMDVTNAAEVSHTFATIEPTLVFHLAGAKHAPLGEEDPVEATTINIDGTRNVLAAAARVGAKVVTASTCKACNPETAYGATKLIAERMTLNAGGSVARFFNVRESSGNVFELWRNLPPAAPLPVTPCRRRFMSIKEAVRLLMVSAVLPSGRYTVTGTRSQEMSEVAAETYPGRLQAHIPPRRGDRLTEPECAAQELFDPVEPGIARLFSPHDLAELREEVAA